MSAYGQGIDITLECEWFSKINHFSSKPDYRYSGFGIIEAIRLLENIFHLVAKEHPDKLVTVNKNIAGTIQSEIDWLDYTYFNEDWMYEFTDSLRSKTYGIDNYKDFQDQLETLKSGKAHIKFSKGFTSKNLSQCKINEFEKLIDYKKLYNREYNNIMDFYCLKFTAYMAFYNRWSELRDSLEWAQPSDTNVTYIGEVLLPKNSVELQSLLLRKLYFFKHVPFFIERHGIEVYLYRSAFFQLAYFYEKEGKLENIYNSGTLKETLSQIDIIKLLLEALIFFKNSDYIKKKTLKSLGKTLESTKIRLEERAEDQKNKECLSLPIWHNFIKNIENGWHSAYKDQCEHAKISEVFNVYFSNNVQKNCISVFKRAFSRTEFLNEYPSVYGYEVLGSSICSYFLNNVYPILEKHSATDNNIKIQDIKKASIFASDKNLESLGLKNEKRRNLWKHPNKEWFGVSSDSEEIILVDRDKFQLVLTHRCSAHNKNMPLFPYYLDKKEATVTVKVDAYIDFTGVDYIYKLSS